MIHSGRTNVHTQREWRELGFFYEFDPSRKTWRLTGSRAGLRRFADLLREYAADPANAECKGCKRYGPYLYLRLRTSEHCGIDGHSIHGSLDDLARLAVIVESVLEQAVPRQAYTIHEQYVSQAEFALVLDVKPDGFDPASADRMLSPM